MVISLNAFPLQIPDVEVMACYVPYDKETLDELRSNYGLTHASRRQGDQIALFSSDGAFPIAGQTKSVALKENLGIFSFLVKDGLKRHLSSLGRQPLGFVPIELISSKNEDNLLAPIIGAGYPFQICAKYTLDTRFIEDRPNLVIDCSTRLVNRNRCIDFVRAGFNLEGRSVTTDQGDGYRKLLGTVVSVNAESLRVSKPDGIQIEIDASATYLEASRENFDSYVAYTHGEKKEMIFERVRRAVSIFNGKAM